jgi:sugar phosphate isomerase/epimerase
MQTSFTRREFLGVAGALPFALQASQGARVVPVGVELYTVRDLMAKDLKGTVTAIAKMGYQIVEFYSPYYQWTTAQATDVRKLLDDLGIKCLSTHNGAAALGAGLDKAIELNRIIGSKYIIMASAPRGEGLDRWKTTAAMLTSASEKLKPLGMACGFHNHQEEWRPIEGQRPMDVLSKNTPQDVVMQFDVGTCIEVGADPIAWINANKGRIKSVHCKEWSPTTGYASLFGEGAAPWQKIFEACESVGGVEYYLIEQEVGPIEEQLVRAEKCLANYRKMRG